MIDAEILDLQGLHDRCLGNLDLVVRVLDKFEQRLPEELAELERAVELGDAAKIALAAHRIKGNSSNISAAGLQQAAAEIEDLSRAGQVADIPPRLQKLHGQWQRYVDCRAALRPAATAAAGQGPAPTSPAASSSETVP
jgi:HPt (histidine-containing phosphotransfer) domain-containing protein